MRGLFLACALIVCSAGPARTQIQKIVIEAEGLEITSLAAKLETSVKNVKSVAKVTIFPFEDRMEVEVVEDGKLDLAKIKAATQGVGIMIQTWTLLATGKLTKLQGKPALWIPQNQVELLLDSNKQDIKRKLEALLERRTEELIKVDGVLETFEKPSEHPVKLWVEKLSLAPSPASP